MVLQIIYSFHSLLYFVMLLQPSVGDTLWTTILNDGRLRQVARKVQTGGFSHIFEGQNMTAFLPVNNAFRSDIPNSVNFQDIMLYHTVLGLHTLSSIQDNSHISSRHPDKPFLYFNIYAKNGMMQYFVNGGKIIVPNIKTDNGILHLIDKVFVPIGTSTTVAQYLADPPQTDLRFKDINMASIVVPNLKQETNDSSLFFTTFAPNDSYLDPMPDYGKDRLFSDGILLKKVYQAHTIANKVLFLPSDGHVPESEALSGEISFYKENGKLFVSNNLVRARVIRPNIPTKNGVIHVIDNLLYYIYKNVLQRAQDEANIRTITGVMLNDMPDSVREMLQKLDEKFTIFAPDDTAFAKIPLQSQEKMYANSYLLSKLIGGHIVRGLSLSISQLIKEQSIASMNDDMINITEIGENVYISDGKIKAQVVTRDLGCTNGIIHIISDVMFSHDYTIFEAIKGIKQLSDMYRIVANNAELWQILDSIPAGPLTLFLPSNPSLADVSGHILQSILTNRTLILQTLRGHIIQGLQISSIPLPSSIELATYAGQTIKVEKQQSGLYISGGNIDAKVIVKDIWCSNGVLHITDGLLYVPTKTVLQEINTHPDLWLSSQFLTVLRNISTRLNDESKKFTLFLPNSAAYDLLSLPRSNELRTNISLLEKVFEAHIIEGRSELLHECVTMASITALHSTLHVKQFGSDVYAFSNNVRGKIVKANIRTTHGVIHIVDSLLYFPHTTVDKILKETKEISKFYDLMKPYDKFTTSVSSSLSPMTLFIPSNRFLNSIPLKILKEMQVNEEVMKKLYIGHVLIGNRVDESFIQRQDNNFAVTSMFNVTFQFTRKGKDMFVDVGFEYIKLDVVTRAYGCTNGIVYIIDGLLNYSPFSVLDKLKLQSEIRQSYSKLLSLVSDTERNKLDNTSQVFTAFIPHDSSLENMTYTDITALVDSPPDIKHKIFMRHILSGSVVTLQQLGRSPLFHDGVLIERTNNGDISIKWNFVEAVIVKPNILASNGIIHIINRFLFKTETTTTPKLIPPSSSSLVTSWPSHGQSTKSLTSVSDSCSLERPRTLYMLFPVVVSLFVYVDR